MMEQPLNPSRPILVVDDEPGLLLGLKGALRQAGYDHVVTCNDSRQVQTLLASRNFELVLLDLYMPHKSGEEILEILRKPKKGGFNSVLPSDVPVAFKPGGIPGVHTEWALVELPERPYVAIFMEAYDRHGESDEILKKAQDEAEALQAQALEDARIEAEQRKERLISTANLDLRKARLAERQDAIDAAFREALESLLNMEDAEYRSIIRKMILPNVQTGDEEIILSERDKAGLGEELLEEVNRQLIETGKEGKLTLSKDAYNILG